MGEKQSKIKYFDGSEYQGEVNAAGKEHGQGQINYVNGDLLKGNFEDGECTTGVITKKSGDQYEGQLRNLQYYGKGKLTTKDYTQDGLFRDGNFLNGRVVFKDGTIYEGAMENECKVGKAFYQTSTGDTYNGYFKNDKFEGTGELKRKDGSSYVGDFKNGEYDGQGKLIKFDKGRKKFEYEGGFTLGLFEGEGVLVYTGDKGYTYKGHFINGKKDGAGVAEYISGESYEGHFRDDLRCDRNCVVKLASGATYEGGI